MGLYFRQSSGRIWTDPSPSITWCEYVAALSAATNQAAGDRADTLAPPDARTPNEREMACLLERVGRKPEDDAAHRLLGLGHVARGQIGSAVEHLETALRLVRQEAAQPVGLADATRLLCETATLRLLL